MGSESPVDTSYDVRTDAGGGGPDRYSMVLRRYHQLLWSKPLPSGAMFDLDEQLHHKSALGEFWLSSDAITHTYSYWTKPPRLVEAIQGAPVEEVLEELPALHQLHHHEDLVGRLHHLVCAT